MTRESGHITTADGSEGWIDGDLLPHRENGPSRIHANGTEEWYKHGKFHRIGGPAITYGNGTKEWYENDKRHRIGGPAITRKVGQNRWFVCGEDVTSWEEYQQLSECSNEDLEFLKLKYESPS